METKVRKEPSEAHPERIKIHSMTSEQLAQYRVSEHSEFRDDAWFFANPTPGARPDRSTINWNMTLLDGSKLTDLQHAARLHWAKILVFTLLLLPADQRRPGPGSMSQLQKQLQWLVSWMVGAGYQNPHELTPSVIRQYLDELPAVISDRSDDGKIGVATASQALSALIHMWNQRQAMMKMGVESLPRHPFEGKGAHTIARAIATKATGWIQPLPDEVTIPLLNKAAWFLDGPADDVLKLLAGVCEPLNGVQIVPKKSRLNRTMQFLEAFEFSIVDGDKKPWHDRLDSGYENASEARGARITRVKELWEAIRDAAAIIIQATTGMRVSELLGILSGNDDETGLPQGVRLELSATGLYEWFIIRSQLSKTEDGLPREVDWVLGMRPVGSKETPLAVRALQILDHLHKPWRANASTDRLILVGHQGISLPMPSIHLGAMPIDRANESMQRFISRWVDLSSLPDESARRTEDNDLVRWRQDKGKMFRTHMLRKAWAQFALACDSRLLPAIQMQFHHMSLAMTETGYIGHNPLLLSELDSMSTQKTNLAVFEIILGKSKVAGRMGDQLEHVLAKLRAEASTLPISERWQQAVEWTERNDLKLFFTPHATCAPIRTSEMRCHDSSQTPVWLRKAPNTATREPSVCAGCACAIMDRSHEPFWSDRYVECEISVRQASAAGLHPGQFREIIFRAEQARNILRKFGADLNALDSRVTSTMESEYAKTEKGSPAAGRN